VAGDWGGHVHPSFAGGCFWDWCKSGEFLGRIGGIDLVWCSTHQFCKIRRMKRICCFRVGHPNAERLSALYSSLFRRITAQKSRKVKRETKATKQREQLSRTYKRTSVHSFQFPNCSCVTEYFFGWGACSHQPVTKKTLPLDHSGGGGCLSPRTSV